MKRLLILLFLLAAPLVASAQTVPVPVYLLASEHVFAFEHDKLNLDHFESSLDTANWERTVTTEAMAGSFRLRTGSLSLGRHTLAVRACSQTRCSAPAAFMFEIATTLPPDPPDTAPAPVTGLRAVSP